MFCEITQSIDDKHKWDNEHERLQQVEFMMLLLNFSIAFDSQTEAKWSLSLTHLNEGSSAGR